MRRRPSSGFRHRAVATAVWTCLAVSLCLPFAREARAGAPLPFSASSVSPVDVLPDEPTRITVYGEGFIAETRVSIEGVGELQGQEVYSDTVLFGDAPVLPPGVSSGWKNLTVFDTRGAFTLPDAILYVEPGAPYLKSCWPYEVSTAGGTLIYFSGRNFHDGLVPGFGGVPCEGAVFVSENELVAVSPALEAPGGVSLYDGELREGLPGEVIARRGSMLAVIDGLALPTLESAEPPEVDARSGKLITVHGSNLRNDTLTQVFVIGPAGVFIGDLKGRELVDINAPVDSITGTAPTLDPAHPATPPGFYDVVYRDPRGESILSGALRYVDHIRAVTPSIVAAPGGTAVVFDGYDFDPSWTPRLGGIPCTGVSYESPERVTAVSPALPAGLQDADMIDAGGTVVAFLPRAVQSSDGGTPSIVSVEPGVVSTRGGDLLTVTTDIWHGDTVPVVAGRPLVNIDASSPLELRGESPPLPRGFHTVRLLARDGSIVAEVENAVEAVTPTDVSITSVVPGEVAIAGGTSVEFVGSGFYRGLSPRLGGYLLEKVEIIDSQHLRGESPPLKEGIHDALVEEAGTVLAILRAAVAAVPPPGSIHFVAGRLATTRYSASTSRIAVPATGLPEGAVLRVGGQPVLSVEHPSPCGSGAGQGGGGGVSGGGMHQVMEGIVPALQPGWYAVDAYLPGYGILAVLPDGVQVVPAGAPPAVARVVSADVQADGSTRLYVFGSAFGEETGVKVGGSPLVSPIHVSETLIVGNAPPLVPGEPAGSRDVELEDPRGGSVLPGGVTYAGPEPGATTFLRGDTNASGRVDISDAVTTLGYLFLGSPTALACDAAADVDGTGRIDITDPIQLLQYLFMGGSAPRAPFPSCGTSSAPAELSCGSGAPCGSGAGNGGGIATALRPNVRLLNETRINPGDPVLVDVSPITGEVVVNDPPGGIDLVVGDVITGFVPLTSAAIDHGVTYQLKLEDLLPGSCMAFAPGDKSFLARPGELSEVFEHFELKAKIPASNSEARISSKIIALNKKSPCELEEGAGGTAGEMGAGGSFTSMIDLDLSGLNVLDFQDGESQIRAGFHRLKILYSADEASLGVGISNGGLTGVDFFSGIILDSEIVAFIQSHLEKTIHEEEKLATIEKHHIIFVFGVPIHFLLKAELFAGIDANAQLNLYADAGVKAKFKAGVGFRFDGDDIHNLSGFEPPSVERVPGTPNLELDGSLTVRPYVRPELSFFAGILFEGLTGYIGIKSELYTRFHATGSTHPVPCFQWGIDAGMTVSMNPEIQLFGFDLFDRTFDVLSLEKTNLFGGELGCKQPPVAIFGYRVEPLDGSRFRIHLDASRSYDPDGGPLKFRWDFDADLLCDRATLGNPRTVFDTGPTCTFDPVIGKFCAGGVEMRIRVTDDEGESVDKPFWVLLPR